jgi:hypothetical protein
MGRWAAAIGATGAARAELACPLPSPSAAGESGLGLLAAAAPAPERAGGSGEALSLVSELNRFRLKEGSMAKGQMRSSKEAKKPKSEKPKSSMSEYKKSLATGGHTVPPTGKKS